MSDRMSDAMSDVSGPLSASDDRLRSQLRLCRRYDVRHFQCRTSYEAGVRSGITWVILGHFPGTGRDVPQRQRSVRRADGTRCPTLSDNPRQRPFQRPVGTALLPGWSPGRPDSWHLRGCEQGRSRGHQRVGRRPPGTGCKNVAARIANARRHRRRPDGNGKHL